MTAENTPAPGAENTPAPGADNAPAVAPTYTGYGITQAQETSGWQKVYDFALTAGNESLKQQAIAGAKNSGLPLILDHAAHQAAEQGTKAAAVQAEAIAEASPPQPAVRYDVNYQNTPMIEQGVEAVSAYDATFQSGAHAMELSELNAGAFFDAMQEGARVYANPDTMTPENREYILKVQEGSILRRLSNVSETMQLMERFEERMKTSAPKFHELLSSTMALRTASGIVACANAQRAYEVRHPPK